MEDERLVASARRGDAAAFEELVRLYQDAVFAVALGVTRSYGDAEDLSQETFLRAYGRLRTLRDPARFGAWVTQIARAAAIDAVRARKRRLVLAESYRASGGAPTETGAADKDAEDLRVLLGSLSETLSETVLLYYVDGYSQKEVGEMLDVPLGTVKRRLHDARKALKQEALSMAAGELQQRKPGPELPELVGALRAFGRGLREGVPVSRILKGIADDATRGRLRCAFDAMYSQVMAGSTLGEAMIRFSDLFPPTVLALVREGEMCGILDETLDSVVEYIETGKYHLPDYRPQGWSGLTQLVEGGRKAGAKTCIVEAGRGGARLWLVSPEGSRTEFEHRWFRENAGRFLYDLRTCAQFGIQTGPEFDGTISLPGLKGRRSHTHCFTLTHDLRGDRQVLTLDLQPVRQKRRG